MDSVLDKKIKIPRGVDMFPAQAGTRASGTVGGAATRAADSDLVKNSNRLAGFGWRSSSRASIAAR